MNRFKHSLYWNGKRWSHQEKEVLEWLSALDEMSLLSFKAELILGVSNECSVMSNAILSFFIQFLNVGSRTKNKGSGFGQEKTNQNICFVYLVILCWTCKCIWYYGLRFHRVSITVENNKFVILIKLFAIF